MEDLEVSRRKEMFNNIYQNKRVLITGHSGFKGSWLALWLSQMGAKITGYSLSPPTEPNHFNLLDVDINSIIGDIRDAEKVKQVFKEQRPEIVFHLAAQPIVRLSYKDPIETFSSNVMGTVNIFEASRASGTVRAIVNVTSDKCYENREWPRGYRRLILSAAMIPTVLRKDALNSSPVAGVIHSLISKTMVTPITRSWRASVQGMSSEAAIGLLTGLSRT